MSAAKPEGMTFENTEVLQKEQSAIKHKVTVSFLTCLITSSTLAELWERGKEDVIFKIL